MDQRETGGLIGWQSALAKVLPWGGAPPEPALKPTPQSVPEPATTSTPMLTLVPAPRLMPNGITGSSDAPSDVAKAHALGFLLALIAECNGEIRAFTSKDLEKERYPKWCADNHIHTRKWNTVAKYLTPLVREEGKPPKTYEPWVDPISGEDKKRRIYLIPTALPADWRERLRDD